MRRSVVDDLPESRQDDLYPLSPGVVVGRTEDIMSTQSVAEVVVIIGEDAGVWTTDEVARRWEDLCALAHGRAITLVPVPEPRRWPEGSRGPDVATCSAGHPWADATAVWTSVGRLCRLCRADRLRDHRVLARSLLNSAVPAALDIALMRQRSLPLPPGPDDAA